MLIDQSLDHHLSASLQLHPEARIQWKRCAGALVSMYSAQFVVREEMVHVGGEDTRSYDAKRVFLYNKTEDKWSDLPRCIVKWFSLAVNKNRLITVRGLYRQLQLSNSQSVDFEC